MDVLKTIRQAFREQRKTRVPQKRFHQVLINVHQGHI
jgi:hypothetical protein